MEKLKDIISNRFMLTFIVSFLISIIFTGIVLYLWYTYSPLLSENWIKASVVVLHTIAIAILVLGAIVHMSEMKAFAGVKIILALVGAFMMPSIVMDIYLPPFVLLFYGAFVSATLTYSGYITIPSSKAGVIEVAIGSVYPLLSPLLFYILYQLMNMPHVVEIAGICHANNIPSRITGPRAMIRRIIRSHMAAMARAYGGCGI